VNAAVSSYLNWNSLEHAFGAPVLRAGFKLQPEDFRVDEELGFEPDGAGEHLLLSIEKTGLTTFEAQAILARHFNVALRDTSFAGMKDKQGVTSQWFSLPAGREGPKAEDLQHPRLRVLRSARNSRKLRRGSHRGNRFRITLRAPVGDRDAALVRVHLLAERGMPNYFGAQRFGYNEANVPAALSWFRGETDPERQQRGLILSAARSYLFNVLLSRRVKDGTWDRWIAGDVMALAGTASTFACKRATSDELNRRLAEFDIHATGPLWGRGQSAATEDALQRESSLAEQYAELCAGVVAQGLEQERRPLRAQVQDLQAHFTADAMILEFSLTRGAYATSVLRELVHPEDA
jgi:tRNA pseudouridine13 synthase